MTCDVCGLPDSYGGQGDGIGLRRRQLHVHADPAHRDRRAARDQPVTNHPPASYLAGTPADYDHGDVDDGALSPMPRGRLDDADFRRERARTARAAQNRPDYHLRQVLRAGSDHDDDRWAIALAAGLTPLTADEAAAARQLAASLVWAADLAEVRP